MGFESPFISWSLKDIGEVTEVMFICFSLSVIATIQKERNENIRYGFKSLA